MREATSEQVDLDSMKFLALDRFMARLEAEFLAKAMQRSRDDVDELQYSFLERCDEILLRSLSRLVLEDGDIDLESCPSEKTWSLRLEEDDKPVDISVLLRDCLEILEQMEDVPESWMSLIFFDSDQLKSLYKVIQKVPSISDEEDGTVVLRESLRELLMRSPLLGDEDRLRFRLVLLHFTPEGIVAFLRRFLMLHLEYGRELQVRCFKDHPEWGPQVQSVLLREASQYAKKIVA